MELIYYHFIVVCKLSQIDGDVLTTGWRVTGDYTESIIFIKMSKKLYSPYNLKNRLKYSNFSRFIDFQPHGAIFNHKQEY